jgi:hypothetical protein
MKTYLPLHEGDTGIVCNQWSQGESGWPWMIAIAFRCGPVHPGLTSLGHSQSSPFGKLRAGSSGLISVDNPTQDYVLGYSQQSLRD